MPLVNPNLNFEVAVKDAIEVVRSGDRKYLTWRDIDTQMVRLHGCLDSLAWIGIFNKTINETFPTVICFEQNRDNKKSFGEAIASMAPSGIVCIRSYNDKHKINFENSSDAVMFRLLLDIND